MPQTMIICYLFCPSCNTSAKGFHAEVPDTDDAFANAIVCFNVPATLSMWLVAHGEGSIVASPREPLTILAQWIGMRQRRDRVGSPLTAPGLFVGSR